MPTKQPTKQKDYFRNARTWKQISTNVPPDMHKALKSQVTRERTMSHVLRELIQQSELMRYGRMARPAWSEELAEDLSALRAEVSSLRAELSGEATVLAQAESKELVAKTMATDEKDPLAKWYEEPIFPSVLAEEELLLPAVEIVQAAEEEADETPPPVMPPVETSEKPARRKPFAFLEKLEKLPEKLGFGRKSA